MAEFHDATEEYLEAILEIEEEGVVPIRAGSWNASGCRRRPSRKR